MKESREKNGNEEMMKKHQQEQHAIIKRRHQMTVCQMLDNIQECENCGTLLCWYPFQHVIHLHAKRC